MSLLVSSAVNEVYQQLNLIGQQIDQSDVFLFLNRAIAYYSNSYNFPTAKKSFNTLFFNGVREYEVPTDFYTLIEPQRFPALWSPDFNQTSGRELTHWPYGRQTSIQYDAATPYLLVSDMADGMSALLEGCDSTDGVTISGDAPSVSLDNQIYTEGTGSLRFTVTGSSGSTTLTFTDFGTWDFTDFLTRNWCFLDLIAPETNTVDIASVTLRIGNDASNYYSMTATERMRGTAIGAGYGQIGFNLLDATETGTVVDTAIDWMQVIITHGTTGINGQYHVDNIITAQGVYFQVPYYSKYNVLSGGVTPAENVTALTDIILVPAMCGEAIIWKALEYISASPNVSNAAFANYCAREVQEADDMLRSTFPMERGMVRSTWYKGWNFKRGGSFPRSS